MFKKRNALKKDGKMLCKTKRYYPSFYSQVVIQLNPYQFETEIAIKMTLNKSTYDISPQPTVVIVTTAHQKPSGIDLKWDFGDPASQKYTVLEKRTTPEKQRMQKWFYKI